MVRTLPRLDEGIVSFEFQPSIGILARDIDRLAGNLSSFRKPLEKAITAVMIPSFRKNFDDGGRPAWVPMSEATQIIRQNQGYGGAGNLLIKSGTLRMTMGQKSIWTITDESASIRDLPSSVWYGKVHQEGYSGMGSKISAQLKSAAKSGKRISPGEAGRRAMAAIDKKILSGQAASLRSAASIPARPFVMFQDEDVDAINDVFDKWMGQEMARVGFVG
jgi:phage gpG-like protein